MPKNLSAKSSTAIVAFGTTVVTVSATIGAPIKSKQDNLLVIKLLTLMTLFASLQVFAGFTAFAQELQCSNLFINDPFALSASYLRNELPQFLNTPDAHVARTTGSFLAAFHVQNGEIYGRHQEFVGFAFEPFDLTTSRGDLDNAPLPQYIGYSSNFPIEPTGHGPLIQGFEKTSATIMKIKRALKEIYPSFASQGPERKVLVPIIQRQDSDEVAHVTHFNLSKGILGRLVDWFGHAQVLVSSDPAHKLHVEKQWGDISREKSEVVGEVGRLIFQKEENFSEEARAKMTPEYRILLRLTLMQKMYAWANNDVRFNRLFFQVNTKVAAVLERIGIPLKTANVREVTSLLDGKEIKELIIEMPRSFLLAAETRVTKQLLLLHIKKFLANQRASGGKIILRYSRNEIPALVRLGIIKEVEGKSPYGNETLNEKRYEFLFERHRNSSLSSRVLRVLSSDFNEDASYSTDFFLRHRVSFATAWELPVLPSSQGHFKEGNAIFQVAHGDLDKYEFLELHLSEPSARFLVEQLNQDSP